MQGVRQAGPVQHKVRLATCLTTESFAGRSTNTGAVSSRPLSKTLAFCESPQPMRLYCHCDVPLLSQSCDLIMDGTHPSWKPAGKGSSQREYEGCAEIGARRQAGHWPCVLSGLPGCMHVAVQLRAEEPGFRLCNLPRTGSCQTARDLRIQQATATARVDRWYPETTLKNHFGSRLPLLRNSEACPPQSLKIQSTRCGFQFIDHRGSVGARRLAELNSAKSVRKTANALARMYMSVNSGLGFAVVL